MLKKVLVLLLSLFMAIGVLPVVVFAEERDLGFWKVEGDTSGYEYIEEDHVLIIKLDGSYKIAGNGKTTQTRIEISKECKNVQLTLDGVKIDVSDKLNRAALRIESGVFVEIKLRGENSLISGSKCAGLQVDGVCELVIYGEGESSLYAKGGYGGAGIGGGYLGAGNNIVINKVQIKAIGGEGGAGIGGGMAAGGSNIRIDNGNIEAEGGLGGAGIGGGIGTGAGGSNITIISGKVRAEGHSGGAGIGGGYKGAGKDIVITMSDVGFEAIGGDCGKANGAYAPAVGGGYEGSSEGIFIDGRVYTLGNRKLTNH